MIAYLSSRSVKIHVNLCLRYPWLISSVPPVCSVAAIFNSPFPLWQTKNSPYPLMSQNVKIQKRQISATFCSKARAFGYFLQIYANICNFLTHFFAFFSYPFYLNHPCCRPTFIYSPKTNMPAGRTKKNLNLPPFFKF